MCVRAISPPCRAAPPRVSFPRVPLSSLPPLFSYLSPFKFPSFFFLLIHSFARSFVRCLPFVVDEHTPLVKGTNVDEKDTQRYDVAQCRGTKSYDNHVTIRTYRNHRLSRLLPTLFLLFDHLRASSPSSIEYGLFTCPLLRSGSLLLERSFSTVDGLRQYCEQTEMYKSGYGHL